MVILSGYQAISKEEQNDPSLLSILQRLAILVNYFPFILIGTPATRRDVD